MKDESDLILRHWREAVPNDRLAHLVKDATRALVRELQALLAERGVSFGHWTFLRILWDEDGLTQRELSRRAGVMEPTTHAALAAMQRDGHVERRLDTRDRRSWRIHLTVAGRRLKSELVPLAVEVNDRAVAGIPAQDIAATRRVLLGIIENLVAQAPARASSPRRALASAPATAKRTTGRGAAPAGGA